MTKREIKKKAITLRKEGKTYSEILKEIPVAKSTLSLWFKDVGLSRAQKQTITRKRLEAGKRGGAKRRQMRIEKTKNIKRKARKQIREISRKELLLIGTTLYWAEGAKEKEHAIAQGIDFGNSDPRMINVFIQFLRKCLGVQRSDIRMGVYIHANSRNRIDKVIRYWSKETGFPESTFSYVYFKKHNPKTKRKKIDTNYYGLIRLRVARSTDLNRKIAGLVDGIVEHSGFV